MQDQSNMNTVSIVSNVKGQIPACKIYTREVQKHTDNIVLIMWKMWKCEFLTANFLFTLNKPFFVPLFHFHIGTFCYLFVFVKPTYPADATNVCSNTITMHYSRLWLIQMIISGRSTASVDSLLVQVPVVSVSSQSKWHMVKSHRMPNPNSACSTLCFCFCFARKRNKFHIPLNGISSHNEL